MVFRHDNSDADVTISKVDSFNIVMGFTKLTWLVDKYLERKIDSLKSKGVKSWLYVGHCGYVKSKSFVEY